MSQKNSRLYMTCGGIIVVLIAIICVSFLRVLSLRPGITPTPAVTVTPFWPLINTPVPSSTSSEVAVEIAILESHTEVKEDGSIQNTAELSIRPLGLGSLQLTSPGKMKMGESAIVSLSIQPDSALLNLPQVSAPTLSAATPDNRYVLKFSDELLIYPVMRAKLWGVNFEIEEDENLDKPVIDSSSADWIWNISPTKGGKQTLALIISVPVILDVNEGVVSAKTLKQIPIEIEVELTATPELTAPPTQTLTPTPIPVGKRIFEDLIDNASGIVGAFCGLLGTLVAAYVAYLAIKKPKYPNSAGKGKKK